MQNSDGRNALDTCISKRHGSGTALASMVARRANRNHAESKRGENQDPTKSNSFKQVISFNGGGNSLAIQW